MCKRKQIRIVRISSVRCIQHFPVLFRYVRQQSMPFQMAYIDVLMLAHHLELSPIIGVPFGFKKLTIINVQTCRLSFIIDSTFQLGYAFLIYASCLITMNFSM